MGHPVTIDEQMLVSAVRYALGRATYIVHSTCDSVRTAWPELSLNARAVILRDIREALDGAKESGTTVGMDFDHREWVTLLEFIVSPPQSGAADETEDVWPFEPGEDGYPTEDELLRLAAFRGTARELMEYTESIWRNGAGVLTERVQNHWGREEVVVTFITGGWSGCEEVIGVLGGTLALMYSSSWQRGGAHSYAFPSTVYDSDEPWDWAFPSTGELPGHGPYTQVRDRLAALDAAVDERTQELSNPGERRELVARALYADMPSRDAREQPQTFEDAPPHFRDLAYRQADLVLETLAATA